MVPCGRETGSHRDLDLPLIFLVPICGLVLDVISFGRQY